MSKQTIAEILELFQNGEQRYDTNAYFKEAVNAIHAGLLPHVILDRVLKEHTILMHLHNEELNKNRVAVGECQRMAEEIARLRDQSKNTAVDFAKWVDARPSIKGLGLEVLYDMYTLQQYQK